MGGDRARDRDRGSGRERQRERRERVVEDSSVGERFDLLESRLESTAALASSTAFRVGNESSRRSLVYFVQGDLKARLESKWATWQRNAALPVQRRPKEKPTPWKLQVYTEFLDYVKLLRQAKRRWNPYSSPLQRSRRRIMDPHRMAGRGLLCWSSGTARPDRQLANIGCWINSDPIWVRSTSWVCVQRGTWRRGSTGRSRTFFRVRVVEKGRVSVHRNGSQKGLTGLTALKSFGVDFQDGGFLSSAVGLVWRAVPSALPCLMPGAVRSMLSPSCAVPRRVPFVVSCRAVVLRIVLVSTPAVGPIALLSVLLPFACLLLSAWLQ